MCRTASALAPFGKVMSVTPACWPGMVSGSVALMTSRMRQVSPIPASIGTRASTRWSAPMTMTCRPAATAQDGIRPGSSSCRRSKVADRSCRPEAMRSMPFGEQVASAARSRLHRRALLPVLVDHLHEGAEADGDQEGDDQGGHGAAKRGLRYQQPVIGRFRDRLRQSLDRIGLDARVRRVCTRHAFDPLGKLLAPDSEGPQSAFRINAI